MSVIKKNAPSYLIVLTYISLLWCFLFPIAKAPSNIAAGLLALAALYSAVSNKNLLTNQLKNKTTIACLLLMFIPVFWYFHPGFGDNGAYIKDSLFGVYMLAMIVWTKNCPDKLPKAIYLILIGTLLTASISLMQHFGILPQKHPGLSLGLHNATLTGAFSLLLVFSIGILSFIIKNTKTARWQIILFSAICIYIADLLLVVPGRTGYLALIVMAGFVVYNLYKANKLMAAGVFIAVIILVMSSDVFVQRIRQGQSNIALYSKGVSSTSVGGRFEMWKISWRLFNEHPFIGSGANMFRKHWMEEGYKKAPYAVNNPHSTYFHIIGSYGVIGFAILLFFFWQMALTSWHNRTNLAGVSVGCFLIIFIIGSLTNTMLTSDFYLTWLTIMGGIASGISETGLQGTNN